MARGPGGINAAARSQQASSPSAPHSPSPVGLLAVSALVFLFRESEPVAVGLFVFLFRLSAIRTQEPSRRQRRTTAAPPSVTAIATSYLCSPAQTSANGETQCRSSDHHATRQPRA